METRNDVKNLLISNTSYNIVIRALDSDSEHRFYTGRIPCNDP